MHDDRTGRVRLARCAATAIGLLAICSGAHAARPFFTEDADIIQRGNCEVELVQVEQRARMTEAESGTSAQLACGVPASTELAVIGFRIRRGAEHWPGAGVGGKTGLQPVGDGALGVAIAYSLLAEKLPGASFQRSRSAISLVGTQTAGRMLFHGNVGFARDHFERENLVPWAAAAEHLGERFDFGGEVFAEGRRSAWLGAGARYAALPDRLSLDLSYAVRTNSARTRRATFGMTLSF